jgi:hypothetical protein
MPARRIAGRHVSLDSSRSLFIRTMDAHQLEIENL